jgi:hypothetical protein
MPLLQPTQMPPPPTPSIHRFTQPQRNFSPPPPPITQPTPAPSPPPQQQQQQITQQKRGRPQKSTEFAPELPATQMPYDLRSRSQVQQTVLPEKPALPCLIVPHFTLAHLPRKGEGLRSKMQLTHLKTRKGKRRAAKHGNKFSKEITHFTVILTFFNHTKTTSFHFNKLNKKNQQS